MAFICSIEIHGFRSAANVRLDGISGLGALVGRNSSGKSNLLRALSLFFADEVEPGDWFDAQRDFFYRPTAHTRREVSVAVEFMLPPEFNFRAGTEDIEQKLGRRFTIRRAWSLDRQRALVVETTATQQGAPVRDGGPAAEQFLKLLNFRYITNRTRPRDVLALESRRLAGLLVRRLRRTEGATEFLTSLQTTAGRFLTPANKAMTASGAPIAAMEIATARALGEMLQVGGLRATGQHGGPVDDEQWGSGHQALGLYEVLRLLDTDYGTDFGWKQATLWLVEEPESGLHQELQTYLASEFAAWSNHTNSKHQILMTTHSPVFAMAASSGFWVEMDATGTTAALARPIHDLVREATERGVSPWTQPVLSYPDRTVVLVEGDIDADVLQHTARLASERTLMFVPPPRLDPAVRGGGVDQIITYLKHFGGLIQNRRPDCPLVILLDWDATDRQLADAQAAYGAEGAQRVIRSNRLLAHPDIGDDFKGIERFYPRDVYEAAEVAGEIRLLRTRGRGDLGVRPNVFTAAKGPLRRRVLGIGDLAELPELNDLLDQVTAAAR